VFFGGINVYLQHASPIFRKTPRALDWLLDRHWLLNGSAATARARRPRNSRASRSRSCRRRGPAVKELRRAARVLKTDAVRPQVVSLPNLMFIGTSARIREELGVPVVCELTGEDIFLDAMRERDRNEIQALIRARVPDVSRFVATSAFYADQMATYLGVPREHIDVAYPGIPGDYLTAAPARTNGSAARPPTIGYLARICPEKGLHHFIDAALLLQKMPGMHDLRAKVAGYVGKAHETWYAQQQARVANSPLAGGWIFVGGRPRREAFAARFG
jgi:glycosyltransferase involved in cell wall biosynthesis